MSIRDTQDYKRLSNSEAVFTAEGIFGQYSESEQLAAWQYIYDHDLWQGLQGWYGRAIQTLLDAGMLETKEESKNG